MKVIPTLAALILLAQGSPSFGEPDAYVPGPDSVAQPGVPQGELITFEFSKSRVFPGTTRKVTVYVPRQYTPAKPACVYVDQDGVQFSAPTVLDNLIARGELPVMIGVFVTPGVVNPIDPKAALARFNRSFEYDGLGDGYCRMLLDEVLPEVETKSTADGRPVRLSHSGNDRAIAGSSSGAIAAFNAAWEHPEAFSRVISAIGTYVGLRGGDRFPILIRKYEPKPIRVFLQDGSGDLNIYAGDWWMANQTMERALEFSGYEVNHAWGDGHHSGKHITSILPDALRWVWKDWPKPVGNGPTQNGALKALLVPGEVWQVEDRGRTYLGGPVFDAGGVMRVSLDPGARLAAGGSHAGAAPRENPGSTHLGPDQRFYSADGDRILAYDGEGMVSTVAEGIPARELVVTHGGGIYATEPGQGYGDGKVWLVARDGEKKVVDTGLRSPTGVTLSPDQSLLYVAEGSSHWIYSYQIQPDGTLADKQRYYWLHVADTEDASHAAGLCCDQAGWLYVATDLGVQVCDQAGRVNAILPVPNGPVSAVAFGGEHFDTLYATSGRLVYRRRLNATGANPWAAPILPPAPKL
jgi:predicted alpha/beta superfamily hydrolase